MVNQLRRLTVRSITLGFIAALLTTAVPLPVSAATLLGSRNDQINTSQAGATAIHRFSLRMRDTVTPVGSISFEFCSNSPVPNSPCTIPAGFDVSSATLTAQSGDVGFSIHPATTANRVVLTRAATNPAGVASVYQFSNVTNPTATGSYYVRLQTYGSLDGTGADIENGGVVFSIDNRLSVSAEVPPYIRFCAAVTITSLDCSTATSFFIDFGELRTNQINKASSQFLVASNATSGFSVTVSGTTLVSGNNVIPALAAPTSPAAGVSQFGMNLKNNTNPAIGGEVVGPGTSVANAGYDIPNQYKFQNGDTLVTVNHSDSDRKYTVSYIANISGSQPAGIYATTLTYICLANF